jgi:hypothetical protein
MHVCVYSYVHPSNMSHKIVRCSSNVCTRKKKLRKINMCIFSHKTTTRSEAVVAYLRYYPGFTWRDGGNHENLR